MDRRAARRPDLEPIDPEVLPSRRDPVIEYLEWLMERAVPVGRWSFGLDGILGLIPGLGDVAAGIVSTYIIARAAQAGVPRAALARMMANVAIDSLLGAIPLVGDLFDFFYKANSRNLRIFQQSLQGRREPGRDWAFVALFIVAMLALLAIPIVLAVMLILRLLRG